MKPITSFQLSPLSRGLFLALCVFSNSIANADAPVAPNTGEAAPAASSIAAERVIKKSSKLKAKVRDPLKFESDIAFKETPPKAITLPGVMKMEGENAQALDLTRARVVSLNNGGSQTVYLSTTEPNRIQLPFVNPRVAGTTDLTIDKSSTSNNVYVGFVNNNTTHVSQVFFEGPDGGPVLGLQIVPKNIPSQTIIVQDDAPAASAEQRKDSKSSEHVTAIQSLMETVALGASPNGYSIVEGTLPTMIMNGLTIEVNRRYSNRDGDIYVYTVTNGGPAPATVRESEFDGDTVQAVSIFPKPVLLSGEKTQVIVLAGKVKGF